MGLCCIRLAKFPSLGYHLIPEEACMMEPRLQANTPQTIQYPDEQGNWRCCLSEDFSWEPAEFS